MTFKFIHAADIHLDSPLKGLERYDGAPVDELRGATRGALANLVELAIEEAVAFVLIAGDLYDGDWKDFNTGLFFVQQMLKLREAGIPVVAIHGNHDAENRMTRALDLRQSVRVLSAKKPETVWAKDLGLPHLDVAFHGLSFATAAVAENVVPAYPAADTHCFNIGLLHTSFDYESDSGHARYAPCKLADLAAKDYQYWALGHIHQREIRATDPFVAYSGNIQGRHIRETGAKGCLLVSVDDRHQPKCEFRPLDVFRWVECKVAAEGLSRAGDVIERFSQELKVKLSENPGLPLAVRVILSGATAAHRQLAADPERWTNEIRAAAIDASGGAAWVEQVKIRTSMPRRAEDSFSTEGPLGEILQTLADLRSDDEALQALGGELAPLRAKLPAELTEGDDALDLASPARLREFLTEVEPLLLARLSMQEDAV